MNRYGWYKAALCELTLMSFAFYAYNNTRYLLILAVSILVNCPLGDSRKGRIRTYINITIIFLVSGIWHGANWTFILWGTLHALAQVFHRLFKKTWDKCNQVFQWLCTLVFVNVMWLIFRADNVKQEIKTINSMLRMESFDISVQLCNCFKLEEVDWIVQHIKPLSVSG